MAEIILKVNSLISYKVKGRVHPKSKKNQKKSDKFDL